MPASCLGRMLLLEFAIGSDDFEGIQKNTENMLYFKLLFEMLVISLTTCAEIYMHWRTNGYSGDSFFSVHISRYEGSLFGDIGTSLSRES